MTKKHYYVKHSWVLGMVSCLLLQSNSPDIVHCDETICVFSSRYCALEYHWSGGPGPEEKIGKENITIGGSSKG